MIIAFTSFLERQLLKLSPSFRQKQWEQQRTNNSIRNENSSTPLILSEDWSPHGQFDDQLDDFGNFGLSENVVGALSAILTGLLILFLTDLAFRITVQSCWYEVDSFAVYRRSLLSRTINPIEALSSLMNRGVIRIPRNNDNFITSRQTHISTTSINLGKNVFILDDNESFDSEVDRDLDEKRKGGKKNKRNKFFPLWQSPIIILIGVCVIVADLLLIFLATNHSRSVNFNRASIPSFEFVDPGRRELRMENVFSPCFTSPLTTQHGFFARGSFFVCSDFSETRVDFDLGDGVGALILSYSFGKLLVGAGYENIRVMYEQYTAVGIGNGTQYATAMELNPTLGLNVLNTTLRRWDLNILDKNLTLHQEDPARGVDGPSWTLQIKVDLRQKKVPKSVSQHREMKGVLTIRELSQEPKETAEWLYLLGGIVRSCVSLTARSRANAGSPLVGPFLDQFHGPLIIKQRPWICILNWLFVLFFVFVIWCGVAFILKWQGGVEERLVWLHVFKNLDTIYDFKIREQEVIKFV